MDAGTAIEALQAMLDADVPPEQAVQTANDLLNSAADAGTAIEVTQALIEAGVSPEEALDIGNGILNAGIAASVPPPDVHPGTPSEPLEDSTRFDAELRGSAYDAGVAIRVMQQFLDAGGRPAAAVVLGNALLAAGMDGQGGSPPLQAPIETARAFLDAGGSAGMALALAQVLVGEAIRRSDGSQRSDVVTSALTLSGVGRSPGPNQQGGPAGWNALSFDVKMNGSIWDGKQLDIRLAAALAPSGLVILSDGRQLPAREALKVIGESHARTPERVPNEPGRPGSPPFPQPPSEGPRPWNPLAGAATFDPSSYEFRGYPVSGIVESTFHFGELVQPAHPRGIDISAPQGTPILAPAGGTVIYVGNDPAWSEHGATVVIIQHDDGWQTAYRHLMEAPSDVPVRVGDTVEQGTRIGGVGDTGALPGAFHVHLELGHDIGSGGKEILVDPLAYLGGR